MTLYLLANATTNSYNKIHPHKINTMTLQHRLQLPTPIIQAPMAGASDATFVVAACQAGALGSLGAGMMSPDEIATQIDAIRSMTTRPFNINLMILSHDESEVFSEPTPEWLSELYASLGVDMALPPRPAHDFSEQLAVLLAKPVSVASFTFGILDKSQVDALHKVGSVVIGTANQRAEVECWAQVGADAVVVQGVGAGGHQGGWMSQDGKGVSTYELLATCRDIGVPLIAAGGITTQAQVRQALDAGASLVAVGTAFLTTHESPVSMLWKDKLLAARADDTILTRAFSGKWARGLKNAFIAQYEDMPIPSYPTQNAYTKALRAYAAKMQEANLLSLWSGVGVDDCRTESVAELIARLTVSYKD